MQMRGKKGKLSAVMTV